MYLLTDIDNKSINCPVKNSSEKSSENWLEIPFSAGTVISGAVNAICSSCTAEGMVLKGC